MNFSLYRLIVSFLGILIISFLVSGCSEDRGTITKSDEKKGVETKTRLAPEGIVWENKTAYHVPEALFNTFNQYWNARKVFDWRSVYALEAPHIKWSIDEVKFTRMHALASEVHEVNVLKVDSKYPDLIDIHTTCDMVNVRTNERRTYWPVERWINVGDKWYHVWKSPFLKFN